MRKYFLLLFLFVFLFFSVSVASAGTAIKCTPASGYNYCWETSHCYNCACAYPKIQYSEIQNYKSGYYIKEVYIDVKCDGDKLYVKRGIDSWGDFSCSSSGCNWGQQINSGKYVLTTTSGITGRPAFLCWDYTYNSYCDSWAFIGIASGWFGSMDVKIVQCYDNNDCGSGYYCDKSGDWTSWNCKYKECESGQETCIGKNYVVCENYRWANKGITKGKCGVECLEGEKCEDTILFLCSNYIWLNQGKVLNKCGVECLTKSDCPEAGELYCKEGDVYQEYDYACSANKCVQAIDKLVEECEYGCKNGVCKEKPSYWIYIALVIASAIVAFLIYKLIKKR